MAERAATAERSGLIGRGLARIQVRDDRGRSHLGSFVRWAITGVASVALDVGLLAILRSGLGVDLAVATVIAYSAGVVVNYTLNFRWSFRSRAGHRDVVVRYAVMVAFNGVTTLAIVHGLHQLGLYYLLAKLVSIGFNAGINFLAGRFWVFADPAGGSAADPQLGL